jgi:hypothetical protein
MPDHGVTDCGGFQRKSPVGEEGIENTTKDINGIIGIFTDYRS